MISKIKITMEFDQLENLLVELKDLKLPSREVLINIISTVKMIFQQEVNVLELKGNFNVFGDIHGQFFDFLNILENANPNYKMLFLGDYVDRGYNSVELIIYLMVLKILKKNSVFLLRGNHENRAQTAAYGFKEECIYKYDIYIYWKICEVFEFFPVAARINETYFCLHGGISPNLSANWINGLDRVQEYNEISCILWGDPSEEIDDFNESQRGAGFIFGKNAIIEFLRKVNCKYLIRSHQLVFNGIEELFSKRCITVWSAPNYCYKCKNIAAIIIIEETNHSYRYFQAASEQYRIL